MLARLWLLLPGEVKKEFTELRARLEAGAVAWVRGTVLFVWTIWAWWAVVVGFLTTFLAYRWIIRSGEVYGDLLESAFDVHRTKVYEALRWHLPKDAKEELEAGHRLTEYLWRGSDQPSTTFSQPE